MAALGPKWIPAKNVLRILCAQAMIFTLSYFTGPLLSALGRPDASAKLEWLRAITGALFLVVSGLFLRSAPASWQLNGMALARAVPNVLFITPVYLYLLMRFARVSLRDVLAALWNPVRAGLSIVAAVYLLRFIVGSTWTRPIGLVATETAIGGAAGLAVLIMLEKQLRGTARRIAYRVGWFFSSQPAGGGQA
jgi:O-antigen/teichoic acid export membrane protein